MTAHSLNLRLSQAVNLGFSEAERKLAEANATGLPGSWFQVRTRTPLFAHLEQLARQQRGPDGRLVLVPGSLEWPPSDLAIRDQPILEAGAYAVPLRVTAFPSTTSLADHPFRRMGFLPVAALDETDQFVMGWIPPQALVRTAPPPYVDGLVASQGTRPPPATIGRSIPPVRAPVPTFPAIPPAELQAAADSGWDIGKIVLAGAVVAGVIAVASHAATKIDPKSNRRARTKKDGWHWKGNVAVQWRGGKPVQVQGWGSVDRALRVAERASGMKLVAGSPKSFTGTDGKRGWTVGVRAS